MLWITYLIAVAGLYWIYDGYGRFLQVACVLKQLFFGRAPAVLRPSVSTPLSEGDLPSIAVLITAHNEAHNIGNRIENLLQCEYPSDKLQIVVAADGCTDATCDIVREYMLRQKDVHPQIRLSESPGLGKTATQNNAIEDIGQDVIVFTDADVVFDRMFLVNTGRQYLDPVVGAVAGHLLFAPPGEDAVVAGQGFFWKYELKLRSLETRLGLLAVVAGSCFSMRRKLFVHMNPSIGEDCIAPLDVVSQGYQVVQDEASLCFDQFEYGSDVVLRKRVRMTLRNWQGTWLRPSLLNPFQHPGYSFALWSHKLLRWLSPVFLLVATASSLALAAVNPTPAAMVSAMPFTGLLVLAAIGWKTAGSGIRIPGAAAAFSFLLVNVAFLVGVAKALTGQRIHSYRNFIPTEAAGSTKSGESRRAA